MFVFVPLIMSLCKHLIIKNISQEYLQNPSSDF
jgi:hypothetical protein